MSNVVTTLILVVAVAIMGTFLVSWSNTSFAIQRSDIANQTAGRINLVREDFVIEDVWFFDNDNANVTIRNTGSLAIEISHIYVNNTQFWNTRQVIPIGNVTTITIDSPVGVADWGPNHTQSILVKTTRGSEAKQVWKS